MRLKRQLPFSIKRSFECPSQREKRTMQIMSLFWIRVKNPNFRLMDKIRRILDEWIKRLLRDAVILSSNHYKIFSASFNY